MNLYVKNHNFWFELENLTRLFFPNEKINVFKSFQQLDKPYIYTEVTDKINVSVCIDDFSANLSDEKTNDEQKDEIICVQMLYKILEKYTGISQPWGLLTGVRPVKLLRKIGLESTEQIAEKRFEEEFFVSHKKLILAKETEKIEKKILDLSKPNSFSLYIGIPFCPSRCSYCSFVMSSIERANKLIEPYVDLLCKEIKLTGEIANELGLRLETVYFGGGTPTTLNAEQLDRLLKTVHSSFDMSFCTEVTVEAGRPDTITEEKLVALKENKVSRISINPQTTNNDVLKAIGRKHSVEQFFSAFELARKIGFNNINTDLIAGLPTETVDSFKNSIDQMIQLKAESITVHTLCLKRASTLTTEGVPMDSLVAENAKNMLEYSNLQLKNNGYIPYYLYRQSRMAGNLENVGWSKPNCENRYNIFVMDETHSVFACGSGGVTKLKRYSDNYLKRVFNFKYPYEYIDRFDEIIKRKQEIKSFYQNNDNS